MIYMGILVFISIVVNVGLVLYIKKNKEANEEINDKLVEYVDRIEDLKEKNEELKKELEFADSTNEEMYGILKEENGNVKAATSNNSYEEFYLKVCDEIERKKRHDVLKFAVMGIFVDFYNEYLDMYGEEAIAKIRNLVIENAGKNLRTIDCLARAKEFDGVLLLLPLTSTDGAVVVANRIQNRMKGHEVEADGRKIMTTLTIAICEVEKNGDFNTIESMISKMKKDGKDKGGNTIVVEKI